MYYLYIISIRFTFNNKKSFDLIMNVNLLPYFAINSLLFWILNTLNGKYKKQMSQSYYAKMQL